MQIGSADTRPRDPDDGVLRMQDLRHGFMVDADPPRPPVIHGKHRVVPFLFSLYNLLRRRANKLCPRSCSGGLGGTRRTWTVCDVDEAQASRLREKLVLSCLAPRLDSPLENFRQTSRHRLEAEVL